MVKIGVEVLAHRYQLHSLAIRTQYTGALLIIIRSRALSSLPLGTSSLFKILASSLLDEEPAEDSRHKVEAHEDEEGVGTDVRNHVWTGE